MRAATDPIIKASGVEKFYGTEVHALKNVSTQVAEGEVVVLAPERAGEQGAEDQDHERRPDAPAGRGHPRSARRWACSLSEWSIIRSL